MRFFDKKQRDLSDEVYTIKKIKDVPAKKDNDDTAEEFQLIRELPQTQGEAFYKTMVKNLNIKDAIFTADSEYITFRVE